MTDKIFIRRQWNDYRTASVDFDDVEDLHWDIYSGGIMRRSPQPFIYGYIMCNIIEEDEIAHSCRHGDGPHRIKVCIVKKYNDPKIWKKLIEIVGPKPT